MDENQKKLRRKKYSILDKLSIVEEYENGSVTAAALGKKYNISTYNISKWVKEKEKLSKCENPFVTRVSNKKQKKTKTHKKTKEKTSEKQLVEELLKRYKKVTKDIKKLKSKIEILEEKCNDPLEENMKTDEISNFYVYLQDLAGGQKQELEIEKHNTVEVLKQKVLEKMPSDIERRIFFIQELNDIQKTVSEYNINNLSTLMIL